jgi:hypothetical protein
MEWRVVVTMGTIRQMRPEGLPLGANRLPQRANERQCEDFSPPAGGVIFGEAGWSEEGAERKAQVA